MEWYRLWKGYPWVAGDIFKVANSYSAAGIKVKYNAELLSEEQIATVIRERVLTREN